MTLKSATSANFSIEDLFSDVFGDECITLDLDNVDDIADEYDDEDTIDDDIDDDDDDGSLFDKK